jgi:integrative and conjugative element protein (TIGR02256 family)
MIPRRFRSDDGEFEVLLQRRPHMVARLACVFAGANETGGVLIGEYDSNRVAAVYTITRASSSSNAGPSWFHRPVDETQEWLDWAWASPRRRYYLGEWHLHPVGPPSPSYRDLEQMAEIAVDARYHCPEPILIIEARRGPWPRRSG